MIEKGERITVQLKTHASKEQIWSALTDVDQMRQWFFESILDFRAEEGFRTQFNVTSGARVFPHLWTVIEVLPCEKVILDWKYEGYSGEAVVSFIIDEQNGYTVLELINEVLVPFTEDIPEFSREACQGGWDYFIKERLNAFLDSQLSSDFQNR